ncbi:MAG: hypothetical protein LBP67_09710 [Bacteroidales bacterium]|jgi:hypothetical protein|nr:hypothetical protein [Bacteroidales bacterium]
MKKIPLLIILLSFSLILFAQREKESNPLRFEINIGNNSTEPSPCIAINCGEYGVVVSYIISTASSGDSLAFVIKLLDVNLETFKETSFVLPSDYYIRAHTRHKSNVFVALSTSSTRKNATDILLVKFNLESGEISTLETSYDSPVNINVITASNNIVLISLIDKKDRYHLLSMNFANKQNSFIYTSSENSTYNILSLIRYTDEDNIYISMTKRTDLSYVFNLFEFNDGISRLKFDKVLGDSTLLTYAAPLKDINGNINSIVGAYFSGNLKNLISSSGFGYSSSGIFNIDINSSSFNLFQHRQLAKDIYYTWQQPLKYLDIDSINTSYIFTTEAYSPKYKVTPQTDYDFYGRPYTRYYQEFIGFTTVQAVNYIFESSGKLLWIGNTEVENTEHTFIPHSKVMVNIIEDEILNAYFAKDCITYKFMNFQYRSEPVEKFYTTKKYNKDIVENEYDSMIEHWYENNYLLYGYQTIRNNSISKNNRRTVFYIQKVAL